MVFLTHFLKANSHLLEATEGKERHPVPGMLICYRVSDAKEKPRTPGCSACQERLRREQPVWGCLPLTVETGCCSNLLSSASTSPASTQGKDAQGLLSSVKSNVIGALLLSPLKD